VCVCVCLVCACIFVCERERVLHARVCELVCACMCRGLCQCPRPNLLSIPKNKDKYVYL